MYCNASAHVYALFPMPWEPDPVEAALHPLPRHPDAGALRQALWGNLPMAWYPLPAIIPGPIPCHPDVLRRRGRDDDLPPGRWRSLSHHNLRSDTSRRSRGYWLLSDSLFTGDHLLVRRSWGYRLGDRHFLPSYDFLSKHVTRQPYYPHTRRH